MTVAGEIGLNGVSKVQACTGGSDNPVVKSTEAAMATAAGVPPSDVSVSVASCDDRRSQGSRRGLSVTISFAVCLQQ